MFLTITTSKATPEQFRDVETFLHEFLPRLKQHPGVLAIYHDSVYKYGRTNAMNEKAVKNTLLSWGTTLNIAMNTCS